MAAHRQVRILRDSRNDSPDSFWLLLAQVTAESEARASDCLRLHVANVVPPHRLKMGPCYVRVTGPIFYTKNHFTPSEYSFITIPAATATFSERTLPL